MRVTVEFIQSEELHDFVDITLRGDTEIVNLFDKAANVKTNLDCIENVCYKVKKYHPLAKCRGVYFDNKPVGYYVFEEDALVSFGLSPDYRNDENTTKLFECIKNEMGNDFTCFLYSNNKRAIKWLQKQGMVKTFDNITILQCQ